MKQGNMRAGVTRGNTTVLRLVKLLREKQLTLSTAESCTGGYIAHLLTLLPGASDYFIGSVVAYDNRVKEKQLLVDPRMIEAHGAVSREVAGQMAVNVARELTSDCSIAVSGIMGPDGGTDDKPVGTVWIATCCKGRLLSRCYRMGDEREENITRTAEAALLQLVEMLKEEP